MSHPLIVYRENHALTQEQLGEKLGITQGMVAHIETGRRSITAENAIAWEKLIGIPKQVLRPDIFGNEV